MTPSRNTAVLPVSRTVCQKLLVLKPGTSATEPPRHSIE